MKKCILVLLIALSAGVALFMFLNQGSFTAVDGEFEQADDSVNVEGDSLESVEEVAETEEEAFTDATEEEVADETDEPASGEGDIAADDAGFTITETPHQDFIRARLKEEPIVLKFYSRT
jgi:hypothetical protein